MILLGILIIFFLIWLFFKILFGLIGIGFSLIKAILSNFWIFVLVIVILALIF